MNKKIFFSISVIFLVMVFLSGCETPKNSKETINTTIIDENKTVGDSFSMNVCKEEKVDIPNYGDPAQRLENCFVKYPSEPTREDKSYYILEDICGQFTKEFMENMLDVKLNSIQSSKISTINNCSYYFNEKEYLTLSLEYLSIENQKKGNESMGYFVSASQQIPMENLVVKQEDGMINVIYLILNPNKFISLRPSSKQAINNEKFIKMVSNLAQAIKDYK